MLKVSYKVAFNNVYWEKVKLCDQISRLMIVASSSSSSFSFFSSVPPLRLQSPNFSCRAHFPAWRLKSQPRGSNPSPETQIPASRLKSGPPSLKPQGLDPRLKAQISDLSFKSKPLDSDPSLKAQIQASSLKASRLKSKCRSSNPSLKAQVPASIFKQKPLCQNPCQAQVVISCTNKQTNKSPPVFYKTVSPSELLPC